MLSKKNRLTEKECNLFLSKRVKVFHTPSLFIRADKADEFKASVAVSKKVFKKAVDRNRLRRVIFESLREYVDMPIHIMVSVKKRSEILSTDKIREEIKALGKDLGRFFLDTTSSVL